MMKKPELEILCVTMHQKNLDKYDEMNIHNCDVIFANQADTYDYAETTCNEHRIRMITTPTRGVGKNRNIALEAANARILLLADDDMVYDDDLFEKVTGAFHQFPDADVIVFGLRYAQDGKVYKTRSPVSKRLRVHKALRYGSCSIAVREEAVQRYNLHFTELFGGGCLYSYGEDTDFILQCFQKKLRIYSCASIIGTTNKDSSTCFSGYDEKYYFDKGALARHSMGLLAVPYMLHMSNKKLESDLSFAKKFELLWQGYKCFDCLISYEEWKKRK